MASTLGVLFVSWLIYVFLVILFIVIPAALNISLGVRDVYKKFLLKLIKVSLLRSENNFSCGIRLNTVQKPQQCLEISSRSESLSCTNTVS